MRKLIIILGLLLVGVLAKAQDTLKYVSTSHKLFVSEDDTVGTKVADTSFFTLFAIDDTSGVMLFRVAGKPERRLIAGQAVLVNMSDVFILYSYDYQENTPPFTKGTIYVKFALVENTVDIVKIGIFDGSKLDIYEVKPSKNAERNN